jgi:hypothetical protein
MSNFAEMLKRNQKPAALSTGGNDRAPLADSVPLLIIIFFSRF